MSLAPEILVDLLLYCEKLHPDLPIYPKDIRERSKISLNTDEQSKTMKIPKKVESSLLQLPTFVWTNIDVTRDLWFADDIQKKCATSRSRPKHPNACAYSTCYYLRSDIPTHHVFV